MMRIVLVNEGELCQARPLHTAAGLRILKVDSPLRTASRRAIALIR
jgi:hypothetical protein